MSRQSRPQFEDRVRFNWGFHDAAQAVAQQWDNPERNFGFAKSAGWVFSCPEDVQRIHPDKMYALGWISGLERARAGENTTSSESAWVDTIHNELMKA